MVTQARSGVERLRRGFRAHGLRAVAALLAFLPGARTGSAQTRVQIITGVVQSEAGAPLENALVTLDPSGRTARRMRTDVEGRFHFTRVGRGAHELQVLRIGFLPDERTVVVSPDSGVKVVVVLRRLQLLDSIRVVARRTGILGLVLAPGGVSPVTGANVAVMRFRGRATTGLNGRFEILLDLPAGPAVLFVTRSGYLSKMMSVRVPKDSAVEVAILLDSISSPGAKRLAMPLADFQRRVQYAGARAAFVPADELEGHEGQTLKDALRYSPSFMKQGLIILDEVTCIYVDGQPRPFATANDFLAGDVEAVEIYGVRADWTSTLADRWPGGVPCGNDPEKRPPIDYTGGNSGYLLGTQPRGRSSRRPWLDSYVRAISIWLKR